MTTAWEAAGMTQEYWGKHALDIRIRLAAQPYMDGSWGYDLGSPAVLWDLPSAMRAGRIVGRSKKTNCSTLTTSLITSVFPDAPWSSQEYGDLQVFGDRLPATDSPVLAALRMSVGKAVDKFQMGEWHLVQGVRRLPSNPKGFSGHAFLVNSLSDGGLEVLEATSRQGIGPCYRQATEDELRAQYVAGLHIAVLRGD